MILAMLVIVITHMAISRLP